MKLFKSLLVAPATLGLLAPVAATANEVTINDFNAAEEIAVTNSRIDGLEARFNNLEAGGFSETTTASFGVDFLVGAVDGASSEATTFGYQMGIGLETSFTGEDALSATIDIGDADGAAGTELGFDDTDDALVLDGLTYTFPLGGATVMVGDNTDISAVYTGACAYSSFTDYMGNCGTGNSVGVGGNGATAAVSYAFDSGFSLAGGVSSTPTAILSEEGSDVFGIEAAYTADSYGIALAYADAEATTYWGVNGMYAFDFATLSAGLESQDDGTEATGFFVGLSFAEVGAGSLDIGMGTTGNFADADTEYYIYEASYAYPVNDSMTITPGVYIREGSGTTADQTGFAVKTSFSF
jgi:hypothetical protein